MRNNITVDECIRVCEKQQNARRDIAQLMKKFGKLKKPGKEELRAFYDDAKKLERDFITRDEVLYEAYGLHDELKSWPYFLKTPTPRELIESDLTQLQKKIMHHCDDISIFYAPLTDLDDQVHANSAEEEGEFNIRESPTIDAMKKEETFEWFEDTDQVATGWLDQTTGDTPTPTKPLINFNDVVHKPIIAKKPKMDELKRPLFQSPANQTGAISKQLNDDFKLAATIAEARRPTPHPRKAILVKNPAAQPANIWSDPNFNALSVRANQSGTFGGHRAVEPAAKKPDSTRNNPFMFGASMLQFKQQEPTEKTLQTAALPPRPPNPTFKSDFAQQMASTSVTSPCNSNEMVQFKILEILEKIERQQAFASQDHQHLRTDHVQILTGIAKSMDLSAKVYECKSEEVSQGKIEPFSVHRDTSSLGYARTEAFSTTPSPLREATANPSRVHFADPIEESFWAQTSRRNDNETSSFENSTMNASSSQGDGCSTWTVYPSHMPGRGNRQQSPFGRSTEGRRSNSIREFPSIPRRADSRERELSYLEQVTPRDNRRPLPTQHSRERDSSSSSREFPSIQRHDTHNPRTRRTSSRERELSYLEQMTPRHFRHNLVESSLDWTDELDSPRNRSYQSYGDNSLSTSGYATPKHQYIESPKFDGENRDLYLDYRHNIIKYLRRVDPDFRVQCLLQSLSGTPRQLVSNLARWTDRCEPVLKRLDSHYMCATPGQLALTKLQTLPKFDTSNPHAVEKFVIAAEDLESSVAPESSDLVHAILLDKLDDSTRNNYNLNRNDSNPTTLISYLRKIMADLFQRFGGGRPLASTKEPNEKYSKKLEKKRVFTSITNETTTDTEEECIMCHATHHQRECEKMLAAENPIMEFLDRQWCVSCGDHAYVRFKPCPAITEQEKPCKFCNGRHTSKMHDFHMKSAPLRQRKKTNQKRTLTTQTAENALILPTAALQLSGPKSCRIARALLDQCSDAAYCTRQMAQDCGFPIRTLGKEVEVQGVNDMLSNVVRHNTTITMIVGNETIQFDAYVVKSIVNGLLPTPPELGLEENELADPKDTDPRVHLLLSGAVTNKLLIPRQQIIKNFLVQDTKVGKVISGGRIEADERLLNTFVTVSRNQERAAAILEEEQRREFALSHQVIDEPLIFTNIERFMDTALIEDNETVKERKLIDHALVEKLFKEEVRQREDGYYVVPFPWIPEELEKLGDSYESTLNYFRALEHRLDRNPAERKATDEFMREMLDLGHMTLINKNDLPKDAHFGRYHAVKNEEKVTTKYRIVVNWSFPTSTGQDLNHCQRHCPKTQARIEDVLSQTRNFPIIIVSDIAKMFRNFHMREEDKKYFNILWRFNRNEPIGVYQCQVLSYGALACPYLAQAALRQIGEDHAPNEEVKQIIYNNFYVDDCVIGVHDVATGKRLITQLDETLSKGNLKLTKWASNTNETLEVVKKELRLTSFVEFEPHLTKLLGLGLDLNTDEFFFNIKTADTSKLSKRRVLSIAHSIFDVLGFLAPIILKMRLIFQRCLMPSESQKWDSMISTEIAEDFRKCVTQLPLLKQLRFPRWFGNDEGDVVQIIGFSDASQEAIAGMLYARVIKPDSIIVTLIAAKTAVVPLKDKLNRKDSNATIPKLELEALKLQVKLYNELKHNFAEHTYRAYCDSEIVIWWTRSGEPNKNLVVERRVKVIRETLKPEDLHHVTTSQNPSDIASRSCFPEELVGNKLWLQGPDFLHSRDPLPETPIHVPIRKTTCFTVRNEETSDNPIMRQMDYMDNFIRMLRFICHVRRIRNRRKSPIDRKPEFNAADYKRAELTIFRMLQREAWPYEYQLLDERKTLPSKHWMRTLDVFLDVHGVMRVGGRLANSSRPYDEKHRIVLPKKHHITKLLIRHIHTQNLHCGHQIIHKNVNNRFYIPQVHSLIRRVVNGCFRCKHFDRTQTQFMSELPEARLTPAPPFYRCGVDLTGAYTIKASNLQRELKSTKVYVCVFICFSTKLVHFEVVPSNSAQDFMNAFDRLSSCYSCPSQVNADRAGNFMRAAKSLNDVDWFGTLDEARKQLAERFIDFKFIPAHAPERGGLWEAHVKLLKYFTKRVPDVASLTPDQFLTLVKKAEGIINSRPLYRIRDPNLGFETISPAHFKIQRSIGGPPQPIDSEHETPTVTRRYRRLNDITKHLWDLMHRFHFSSLVKRYKWTQRKNTLKEGDLVLLEDNQETSPFEWKKAVVHEIKYGTDGLVRTVLVRFADQKVEPRNIKQLVKIPREDEAIESRPNHNLFQEAEVSEDEDTSVELEERNELQTQRPEDTDDLEVHQLTNRSEAATPTYETSTRTSEARISSNEAGTDNSEVKISNKEKNTDASEAGNLHEEASSMHLEDEWLPAKYHQNINIHDATRPGPERAEASHSSWLPAALTQQIEQEEFSLPLELQQAAERRAQTKHRLRPKIVQQSLLLLSIIAASFINNTAASRTSHSSENFEFTATLVQRWNTTINTCKACPNHQYCHSNLFNSIKEQEEYVSEQSPKLPITYQAQWPCKELNSYEGDTEFPESDLPINLLEIITVLDHRYRHLDYRECGTPDLPRPPTDNSFLQKIVRKTLDSPIRFVKKVLEDAASVTNEALKGISDALLPTFRIRRSINENTSSHSQNNEETISVRSITANFMKQYLELSSKTVKDFTQLLKNSVPLHRLRVRRDLVELLKEEVSADHESQDPHTNQNIKKKLGAMLQFEAVLQKVIQACNSFALELNLRPHTFTNQTIRRILHKRIRMDLTEDVNLELNRLFNWPKLTREQMGRFNKLHRNSTTRKSREIQQSEPMIFSPTFFKMLYSEIYDAVALHKLHHAQFEDLKQEIRHVQAIASTETRPKVIRKKRQASNPNLHIFSGYDFHVIDSETHVEKVGKIGLAAIISPFPLLYTGTNLTAMEINLKVFERKYNELCAHFEENEEEELRLSCEKSELQFTQRANDLRARLQKFLPEFNYRGSRSIFKDMEESTKERLSKDFEIIITPMTNETWRQFITATSAEDFKQTLKSVLTLSNSPENEFLFNELDIAQQTVNNEEILEKALTQLIEQTPIFKAAVYINQTNRAHRIINNQFKALRKIILKNNSFLAHFELSKLNVSSYPLVISTNNYGQYGAYLLTPTAVIINAIEKKMDQTFARDPNATVYMMLEKYLNSLELSTRKKRVPIAALARMGWTIFRASLNVGGRVAARGAQAVVRIGTSHLGLLSRRALIPLASVLRVQHWPLTAFRNVLSAINYGKVIETAAFILSGAAIGDLYSKTSDIQHNVTDLAHNFNNYTETSAGTIIEIFKTNQAHFNITQRLEYSAQLKSLGDNAQRELTMYMDHMNYVERNNPIESLKTYKEHHPTLKEYDIIDAPLDVIFKARRFSILNHTTQVTYTITYIEKIRYDVYAMVLKPSLHKLQPIFTNQDIFTFIAVSPDNRTICKPESPVKYMSTCLSIMDCEENVFRSYPDAKIDTCADIPIIVAARNIALPNNNTILINPHLDALLNCKSQERKFDSSLAISKDCRIKMSSRRKRQVNTFVIHDHSEPPKKTQLEILSTQLKSVEEMIKHQDVEFRRRRKQFEISTPKEVTPWATYILIFTCGWFFVLLGYTIWKLIARRRLSGSWPLIVSSRDWFLPAQPQSPPVETEMHELDSPRTL